MAMTLPSFRINQPGGGGTGTLDTARPYGLREGVAVNLVTTETGPYLWEIVAAPPGSSATISNSTSATATITPDVNNLPWRIRLTTGTGISAKTRVFVMGADLDASGVEVGDGFMPPAYGEREGEDNSDSRGYAARVEYIIETLRAGGGGGGGTLAGDATGPAGSNTVEAIQNIPVDFIGSPDPGTALVVEDTGLGPRIRARQRHISRVYYDEGNLTAQVPVYNSFDDAFAAAAALLIIANGPVELVVLHDNDPPAFPASTFDGFGLIDIVGSPAVRGQRIDVNVEDGFLLRNPRSLRNLYVEHDTSTPWLETTGGADLNLVLDNTRLYVNGVSTDICTLAAASTGNRLQLINGSSIEGDTGKFATLVAGKTITAYIDSGTINGEIFGGSAGTVVIFQGPDGSVEPQASFSGGISYTSAVITALSQAPTNVAFNDKRLTTIASPTSGTDATNQNWVDGAQSVSVAGSGSVSLNAANISRGSLQLTGALTGDRTVTLPSGTRSLWIRNGTTGLYTLRLEGPSGGFCYLLPGQDRRVYVDGSGILRGEALYLCETEITVNCVGVNNTTIPLLRLPAGFVLERVERYLVTAFATGDGDYTDSVGATSTDDILVESGGIGAGQVYGLDSASWGSNFSGGYYLFTSEDTLDYHFIEFNETVALTAGAVRVRVAGRYFGS